MDAFAEKIVESARGYLGVRWKRRGRGRHEGLDCGGVPICVGREVGSFPFDWDWKDYRKAIEAGAWGAASDIGGGWPGASEVADPEPGDLVLVAGPTPELAGQPWHVGVMAEVAGVPTLIHMDPGREVVEEPLEPLLRGRRARYFRLRRPGGA